MNTEGIPSWFLQLWGTIEGGVSAGLSTHDLWNIAYNEAIARGLPVTGWDIQWMNTLRANAASIRRAGASLQAAIEESRSTGSERSITTEMWAAPWWGRGEVTPISEAQWQIRVPVNRWNPRWMRGDTLAPQRIDSWITIHSSQCPLTISELDSMIADALYGLNEEENIEGTTPKGVLLRTTEPPQIMRV